MLKQGVKPGYNRHHPYESNLVKPILPIPPIRCFEAIFMRRFGQYLGPAQCLRHRAQFAPRPWVIGCDRNHRPRHITNSPHPPTKLQRRPRATHPAGVDPFFALRDGCAGVSPSCQRGFSTTAWSAAPAPCRNQDRGAGRSPDSGDSFPAVRRCDCRTGQSSAALS